MPRPAPQVARSPDPARANARCNGCHQDIAREWQSSMHAQSDSDPVYRRALALEPSPFCRGCHAPEADPRADASPSLSAVGVGCVTCHVTVAGPDAPTLATSGPGATAPHAVARASAFATAAACATCHEFDFPVRSLAQPAEKMQSTVSEHAASRFAQVPCSSCHMPSVTGSDASVHRSHAFSASRDVAMLRAALSVTAERASSSRATLTLTPGQVGHAFPTGDLFRRLVISAEAVDGEWIVSSEASRSLRRRFEMRHVQPGYVGRHMVEDNRVGVGGPQVVTLELGERAVGRAVAWRVEYQRVEHPLGPDESGAVVADSLVVAEGLIPATEGSR